MPYFSSSPQKTDRDGDMSWLQQTKIEANGYTSACTHEPNSNDFPRFIYYIKRFTEMRTCTLTRCHSQMPSSQTPILELNNATVRRQQNDILDRITFTLPAGENTAIIGPKDRKSTRLNSSHVAISYAVFC